VTYLRAIAFTSPFPFPDVRFFLFFLLVRNRHENFFFSGGDGEYSVYGVVFLSLCFELVVVNINDMGRRENCSRREQSLV